MGSFHETLWALLPQIYRLQDRQGDLDSLLRIVGPELDDLKQLIDAIPDQIDVDRAPEKFLPYLAGLVGVSLDGLTSSQARRREIREAVEGYRRKGTIPAILRDLDAQGWHGRLRETFRDTLRLNRRSVLNQAHIPGRIYSFGVFRIESDNQIANLRETLSPHHPAGTKAYFRQWLATKLSAETYFEAWLKQIVQRVAFVDLDETIQLNRVPLNSDRHLTRKKTFWELADVTQTSTLEHEIIDAGTCLSAWHARTPTFTMNRDGLNQNRRLPNLWVSERRFSECCPVIVDTDQGRRKPTLRISRESLNLARLNSQPPECDVFFRQKDLLSLIDAPVVSVLGGHEESTLLALSQFTRNFRVGNRLNGAQRLQSGAQAKSGHTILIANAEAGSVRAAGNLVHRWQRRTSGCRLNNTSLNRVPITDAHITDSRATFELRIDVAPGSDGQVLPLHLNRDQLNQHGPSLATTRTMPMRLARMRLNQSGLPSAERAFHWQFRQVDSVGEQNPTIETAINLMTATIWPQGGSI